MKVLRDCETLRWLLLAPAALCGCHAEHPQSMLHPAGAASDEVAWLWWFLFTVCTAVFLAVIALTAAAVLRRPEKPEAASPLGNRFIVVSGVVLPAIVLLVILLVSMKTQTELKSAEADLTVRVTGHQWWWEVEYPER
jgi:cytochrome c oxidase subunit II